MSRHCKTLGQTTPAAAVCRLFGPLLASILYAVLALALQAWPAWAEAQNAITGLDFSMLPGDRVQIVVTASGPLAEPRSFSTDNPARIAIDFDNTANQLPSRNVGVQVGEVRSIAAVEAGNRTRLVINLVNAVPHQMEVDGNQLIVTVGAGPESGATQTASTRTTPSPARDTQTQPTGRSVEDIDFRRGSQGEGRVVVTLSDPNTVTDMKEQGGKLVVTFFDTSLPDRLMRRFDVTDFATPITSFEVTRQGKAVRMTIKPQGDYQHLAYQADNQFAVEVRPLTTAEKEEMQRKKTVYTGERLSLNFQDIEVRSVLQLLADFTGLNMVVSDTVSGNITLRLKNVPWDQAMDIILKTKGLSMRQTGNVVLVAPTEEIAAREKLELESQQQIEELAPLRSEYIQINYAKATDLAALIKSKDNNLLSERGNVTLDERTNTLLIQDTEANLEDIQRLVQTLDVPVRQVLIESRIVIATDDFSRNLGVRFGFNRSNLVLGGNNELFIGGSLEGGVENTQEINAGPFMADTTGTPFNSVIDAGGASGLMVNLPATSPTGAVNFLLGKVGSYLLQLELSAAEQEGNAEIISSPRVITANQSQATIKTGTEIPYQEATSSGATSVTFKEAVLQLDVTPQITPDDRVFMELEVTKDNPDFGRAILGTPPIDTRQVKTSVLVDNGETVVLGGVFERTTSSDYDKVPFFADIPAVGNLFKSHGVRDQNSELLIFVTPKILKETLSAR